MTDLRARYLTALGLVHAQAEDVGTWAPALTVFEAYLQERLRDLHAAIEGNDDARDWDWEPTRDD